MAEDSKVISAIKEAVDKTGRYPFLFIGSGLSKRYMGTPSWDELLKTVCLETLDDPFAYARFLNNAKIAVANGEVDSELPYVATLMEAPVGESLLSSPKFEGFREGILNGCRAEGRPCEATYPISSRVIPLSLARRPSCFPKPGNRRSPV